MAWEILVGGGLVLAGAAAARVLLRRREAASPPPPTAREADAPSAGRPRGLRVGDVLLYGDEELWLAGALHLDEEGFAYRLFAVPGDGPGRWLLQLDHAAQDLAVGQETDEVPAGSVPERLPIGGRQLALEARGVARVRSEGEHLPRHGTTVRYTLLSEGAGRVLMVLDAPKAPRLALLGDRVGRHMLDLLPGGGETEGL